MGSITRLCTRACWVEGGSVVRDGTPGDVVASYLTSGISADATWSADSDPSIGHGVGPTELSLLQAGIRDASGRSTAAVRFDQPFRAEVSYRIDESIHNPVVLVSFTDLAGNLIFESWDSDSTPRSQSLRSPGVYLSSCTIPKALLKPGRYWMSIGAHVPNRKLLDRRDHVLAFDVVPVEGGETTDRLGLLSPVLEWEIVKLA
jgi:hypothetical protein